MSLTIYNNFPKFKEDFKTDTGLEFSKETISMYTQYFNARINDINCQYMSDLKFKIGRLPNELRNEISDLLRTHEVIKDLLKPKP